MGRKDSKRIGIACRNPIVLPWWAKKGGTKGRESWLASLDGNRVSPVPGILLQWDRNNHRIGEMSRRARAVESSKARKGKVLVRRS